MFASLFNNPRTKIMSLVVMATAALLVVALISLGIVALFANKPVVDEEPTPSGNGNGIPAGFVTTTFAENQLYKGALIATTDAYPFNAEANADVEMISIDLGRKINGANLYSSESLNTLVQKEAIDALNAMVIDFMEAVNDDNLYVTAYTDSIYTAGNTFALCHTRNITTKPKPPIYTDPDNTYDWFFKNAYKYGFVQMFEAPSAGATTGEGETAKVESQEHIFRYVGVVHAQLMNTKKIATFDAYLAYLRESTSPSKNASVTVEKKVYKVYYIAADAQQVIPEKYKEAYTVSGDNMGGYIVTYCTTTSK